MELSPPAVGAMAQKSTNQSINLLRFVFSLIIVSLHMFHGSGILDKSISGSFYFFHGNAAVEFFFLVSGFLMAVSADRQITAGIQDIGRDSMRFMLRKIKSVLLPTYVTWVIAFIFYQSFARRITAHRILSNLIRSVSELLFLRNAGFQGYHVIGPIWYISAMLLTMAACYPLLLKCKNAYFYCVAPLTAAFLLGYLDHEYGTLVNVRVFVGVIYKCQLRAIAVINLGVFLYAVYRWFKTVPMTKFGTALLSITELLFYALAMYYMCAPGISNMDFYAVFALSVAVLITFSQRTWLRMITERFPALCGFLNKFSLYLYLSHGCLVAHIIPIVAKHFGTGKKTYCIGLFLFFVMALLVMGLTALVRKALPHVKKLLVKDAVAV